MDFGRRVVCRSADPTPKWRSSRRCRCAPSRKPYHASGYPLSTALRRPWSPDPHPGVPERLQDGLMSARDHTGRGVWASCRPSNLGLTPSQQAGHGMLAPGALAPTRTMQGEVGGELWQVSIGGPVSIDAPLQDIAEGRLRSHYGVCKASHTLGIYSEAVLIQQSL